MQMLQWEGRFLVIALTATFLAIGLGWLGLTQTLEWQFLDRYFQLRPLEPADSRIVVVTIDDADITTLGRWPITDEILSQVLNQLNAQQPRVIALDLYRDLPVEPGQQELIQTFRANPNIIGIEKQFGTKQIPPAPTLAELNQVALADIVEDGDGTVRRGLLSANDEEDNVHMSLGVAVALQYLAADKIAPEAVAGAPDKLKLGQAIFQAFGSNDGGYFRADAGGYQILLNYRGTEKNFQTRSLTEIMRGELESDFLKNRIVFIGSTAGSLNDFFLTPYDRSNRKRSVGTAGVFIHANLTSQILSAALDGRSLIHTLPDFLEWVWALFWSMTSSLISWNILWANGLSKRQPTYFATLVGMVLTAAGMILSSYVLFLGNWWIPVTPALLGLTIATIASLGAYNQKLQQLAYVDGLTQVANRRHFEQQLARKTQISGSFALILCDVDYFKKYNDTYGHQAGDFCLRQVASAIRQAVRQTDLVARYGGEEFVVILPRTSTETAATIAVRMLEQIRALQIPHATSTVSNQVTISCGVVSVEISPKLLRTDTWSAFQLVSHADKALYTAKEQGRNQFVIVHLKPENF